MLLNTSLTALVVGRSLLRKQLATARPAVLQSRGFITSSLSTSCAPAKKLGLTHQLSPLRQVIRYYSSNNTNPSTSITTAIPPPPKKKIDDIKLLPEPKLEENVDWKILLRLFSFAKYDKKLLALAICLLLLSCSIGMLIPKAYGLILDSIKNIYDGNKLPPIIFDLDIYPFMALISLMLLVGIISNYFRVFTLKVLGEKLVSRLRSRLIKRVISQDAEFYDRNKVGDLISRLGTDSHVVSKALTQNISDGCKHFIVGTFGLISMYLISTELTTMLAVFLPVSLIGTVIVGKKFRILSKKIQQSTGNLSKIAEEQLNGIKTTQSFVAESKELHKYNLAIKDVFQLGKKEAKLYAGYFAGTSVISDFSFVIILTYGVNLVLNHTMTIGDLTAYVVYADYVSNSMFGLANFYSELMKGTGAASRLFEILDYKPKINPTVGKKLMSKPRGEIEFRNVSFNYPTRPEINIFKNLNFKIPAFSNVCIVGPSGRGKSTITSLIMRNYNLNSGEILLDGEDISKYNLKSLRRYLGVVQQEPILMSGTIRDNILYGIKDPSSISEAQIIEAAKMANCHDFISQEFPHGYNTIIGPRGSLLSGGQKQRISIARALIKNPAVLILDEATSALDTKSESKITKTLQNLMQNKNLTTISIAHRLSTIKKAELIIVLGYDGQVVEIGGFNELYNNHESALFRLLNEEQQKSSNQDPHSEAEKLGDIYIEKELLNQELISTSGKNLKFDQQPKENHNELHGN